MEEALANAASLLDTLWEFEKAAAPLNSPEDKAGLKARLLDHVEAIQHPDIRALYKRELLERFSSFAFPPAAAARVRPVANGRRVESGFAPRRTDTVGEARDRLTRAMQGWCATRDAG